MMGSMTKFAAVALALLAAPLGAQLNTVQTVYFFPMGNGLDQYLANRLTAEGVLQVVTDPLKADAVFTDRLGEGFEAKFAEIYIAPEEEKRKAEEKKANERKADEKESSGIGDFAAKPPARMSSFGRGSGTLFLVERKSQTVVWSVYDKPRDVTPRELDRVAGRVVEKLKKARSGK
jgi:hypothetical protein